MLKRLPSLNSIKVFEATARLKSFKAAAHELNVSPTAVSHQISELEKELGIKLFVRGFRMVTLTDEGEKLAAVSTKLISELKQTLSELTAHSKKITISTTHSFAAMWLVPRLNDFKTLYPDIDIQIKADDQLVDINHDLSFDMAIRYGIADLKDPHVTEVVKDTFGLFATQQYWANLTDQPQMRLFMTQWKNADLLKHDHMDCLSKLLEQGHPKPDFFEDENQVIQAALAGLGVAVVSKILVQQSVAQGWLGENGSSQVELESALSYYTVLPKRHIEHKGIQSFQQWLKQQFTDV
ncbi:LysR family transcriptional regulator [Acinetobacter sp. NIPH 2699]|uniref:LysR family transcriptional regulator n=1 Tax=Acinetobacter sp. NIPH 2699 TaxID=2923433 RepID=UPI001F4AB5F9|nr:LysR family transcriptional regulator [Acinetobacter sp. NIPH 2699]MCH7337691.1 LysR family transcriptional regulator [Acinetobacter sp. NIPH 2699]